jgi:hypothetical protein
MSYLKKGDVSFQIAESYRYLGDVAYCYWYNESKRYYKGSIAKSKMSIILKLKCFKRIAICYYYLDEFQKAKGIIERIQYSNHKVTCDPEIQMIYFDCLIKLGQDSLIEEKRVAFEEKCLKLKAN